MATTENKAFIWVLSLSEYRRVALGEPTENKGLSLGGRWAANAAYPPLRVVPRDEKNVFFSVLKRTEEQRLDRGGGGFQR
jgi:hypothetical protein